MPDKQPPLHAVLHSAIRRFSAAGIANAAGEARLLAGHYLAVGSAEVFLHLREPAPKGLASAIERRERREPLQHIIGSAPFGPLDMLVGPGVFIPRPETEVLAQWAVDKLVGDITSERPVVLDLCTGTGALAAYIAHEFSAARVIGVEYSSRAMRWAEKNLYNLQQHCGLNYELVDGDVLDPTLLADIAGQVDLIVCNPPYVPRDDTLDAEVYADPDDAVFAGESGMDVINGLAVQCARLLRPGGLVGIEHDDATSEQSLQVFKAEADLCAVTPLADLTGRKRFVTAAKRVKS